MRAGNAGVPAASNWQALLDALPWAVLVLSCDGLIEKANGACCAFWRIAPGEEPAGKNLRAFFRAAGDAAALQAIEPCEQALRRCDARPFALPGARSRRLAAAAAGLPEGRRLLVFGEAAGERADERAQLAAAVLDEIPDPVFVKDENLRYVLVNRAYARLWNSRPEAMIGRRAGDFASAACAAGFETTERRVLASGRPFEASEEFASRGTRGSRAVRKRRLRTPDGRAYVTGFLFDQSEARRQLEGVLDSMPAGIIIYDRDDRLVLANRLIQEMLPGLGTLWTPGSPLRDGLLEGRRHGYFRASGDAETDRLFAAEENAWVERYIRLYHRPHAVWEREHPDGRWFQVFDTRTPEGMFIGVRLDITELKRREEQLRRTLRENELFQSLIDNVPVSIYAKRPDLRLTYVNQGWCALTGRSREEAIGRTDVELFGADGETYRNGDLEVLRSGETRMIEEAVPRPGGGLRHHIARKGVVTASDGSVYLIGSTTEITELKEREAELREARSRAELADKAKGEFLANVSHEIRTPMNGVLGMAELLARTELDGRQRAFVDIINKSGNALLTIINDILDFSKIDAGQMTLDAAPFELAEAIEDVTALLATRAEEKALELAVRIDPALPAHFVGDAGRFRQVVTNLVGNALKFTEAGHVLVDVSGARLPAAGEGCLRTRLTIAVSDTGIGIPADKLAHVFEKFAQADASATRRHEGTGLGLAISAKLAALMGGTIGVRSAEGKGSTFAFTVTLPEAEVVAPPSKFPPLAHARVLVVDASAVNRAILLEQARGWGADACATASGAEALGVLEAAAALGRPVDCVILDHDTEGMTGPELAARVRALPAVAATPLVLVSSVDRTAAAASCGSLAFQAQLVRPARSGLLREVVVSAVSGRLAGGPPPEAASAESGREALPPPARAAEPQAHRVDILVAEDNEVNQLVFSQILAGTPYTFQIVGNGRLACQAFHDMNPRMILMDVAMPEMNGLEACAAIRRAEAGSDRRVPVVGVTAHALQGDRDRCLEAGMDDYLSKPVSSRALLEKLERWSGGTGT